MTTTIEQAVERVMADRIICPIHGIPDCGPLLNGCSIPQHLAEYRGRVVSLILGEPSMLISIDFLRETLVPTLAEEGLAYVHCPEWQTCGNFTIAHPDEVDAWVCLEHGLSGEQVS